MLLNPNPTSTLMPMSEPENALTTTKDDEIHHYVDERGEIHAINTKSGEVVATAPQIEDNYVEGRFLNPVFIKGNTSFWKYSPLYRDLITQRIAEGMSFTKISQEPGFPSVAIIAQWRKQYPKFNELIKAAKLARAEGFVDTIIDSLDETKELHKDEVAAAKLHLDKLKWLAEKSDPSGYGTKNVSSEGSEAPATVIIQTGVPLRDADIIEIKKEDS